MIALLLKATLVLAGVALLDVGVLRRRGSAAGRHLGWTLAVVALLLLPLATAGLPAWRVLDLGTLEREAAVAPIEQADATGVQPTQTTAAPVAASSAPRPEAVSPRPIDAGTLALVLYAGIALLLLLKVAAEHALVARLTRACRVLDDADSTRLVDEVRASLGVTRPVLLLEGPDAMMPLTWGTRRPCVLLPESAASWPAERRRAVLLHEIAHVARQDCVTQTLASVVRALYWAHPGAWLAARRMRIERELACDEMAVQAGIPRLSYAEHLLEIARSHRAPRLSAGAVAMARSRIEPRLRALIDGPRAASAPSRRAKLAALAASVALLVPLAAMAPAQTVDDVTGRWDLRLAERDEGQDDGTLVHLMLRAPGMNTQYLPIDAFDDLSVDDIRRDGAARFTLRRGPGTFRFEGAFADGRGSGTFVFTPDPRFGDALVARGMERPTEAQLFTLARHGMDLDFLDELAAQRYPQPTTDLYVRTSLTGVDLRVLRELRANDERYASLESLVSAWNNGEILSVAPPLPPVPGPEPPPGAEPVPAAPPAPPEPDAITPFGAAHPAPQAVPALGATQPPAAAPTVAARPGAEAGPAAAAPPTPVALPGARPAAAPTPVSAPPAPSVPAVDAPPAAAPLPPVPTPRTGAWNLIPARGGHVLELLWDDDTQWRRGFDLAELTSAPSGESGTWLIDRDAGRLVMTGTRSGARAGGSLTFEPKPEFGAVLRALGFTERRAVSDHDLKNLTWGNVGERELRAFRAQFEDLTYDDVIAFAIRGVTPAYVESMRAAGVEVRNARDVIELRFAGVTVADVRALRDAGQRDMSAEAVRRAAQERG